MNTNFIIIIFLLLGMSLGISLTGVIQRGEGWINLILTTTAIVAVWISVLKGIRG